MMRYPQIGVVFLACLISSTLCGVDRVRGQDDGVVEIAVPDREEPVDFQREILPILKANCLACHNGSDAESELVLETPETIKTGGSLGEAVVPGNADESLLLQVTSGTSEPVMPPPDNDSGAQRLSPDQLGLLKLWINQGAKGEVTHGAESIEWRALPGDLRPILATAITCDGKYAACGRGNQIFLYQLATGREFGPLVDPHLVDADTGQHHRAHLDLVQSLAFSPDGHILASGGFRTIKLWERNDVHRNLFAQAAGASRCLALHPDGSRYAVGDAEGYVRMIETQTAHVLQETKLHTGPVTALVFSSDGSQLYSASLDGTVRRRAGDSTDPAATLTTPGAVTALALIEQHGRVVTGHQDTAVRVWSATDGWLPGQRNDEATEPDSADASASAVPLLEFGAHGKPITALEAVPGDAPQFLSASEDGSVRQVNAQDGLEIRAFEHGAPVSALAVHPDGTRLVSGGQDGTIKLWNAADGKLLATVHGDQRLVSRVAGEERTVQIAQLRQQDRKKSHESAEKDATAKNEALAKATAAKTEAEKVLNEKSQAASDLAAQKEAAEKTHNMATSQLAEAQAAKAESENSAKSLQAALARAKERLAPAPANEQAAQDAGLQEAAQAIDEASEHHKALLGRLLKVLDSRIQTADAGVKTAKGALDEIAKKNEEAQKQVASAKEAQAKSNRAAEDAARDDKSAKDALAAAKDALAAADASLAAATQSLDTAQQALAASRQPVTALAFSSDGSLWAAADGQGIVQLYTTDSTSPVSAFNADGGSIAGLAFLPGDALITTSRSEGASVWDTAFRWSLRRTIGDPADPSQLVDRVLTLAFSPDGQQLVSGGGEPSRSGEIKIWNVADGSLVRELEDAHSDTVFSVQFSTDGKYLASSAADRMIKVFRMDDGSPIRTFEGHTHHVLDLSWRADGKWLASCGADNVIKVWDFDANSQVRTIQAFKKEVTSIAFLGTSPHTVASSGDRSIRVHNAADGKQIRTLDGAADYVYTAATSGDGSRIIAGGLDGVLRVWNREESKVQTQFSPP